MTASAVTPAPPVGRIDDVDVTTEMQGSFLEYAYSVIYSRALPDARDGLKPVQRRILYLMRELGLRPDRGHVKSARVVGEVMGKLHPHGDAAIYDALVRLAQHFTLRVPLVDGHGNFGSLDDGPAAARYTEVRLASPAMAMTEGLDEDVVDFVPNYDGSEEQPSVLPSAIPNLLVNGASGIAVGMATNMAPHNLVEVVGAACHLLEHPDADLAALMEFVPGPDLPSGGTIVGLDGIRDAYAAGRGVFRTRATVVVEQLSARKTGLVVTELPYLVGPEKVIEKIKDGVNAKKLVGIADVSDFTDRTRGLRLVIGVKTGFNPQAVLAELYRLTPLEESFAINNVALVEGQPHTLGLRELLRVFLGHRTAVVTRRSEYRLARRRERLHLVDGLLIAILDIDEVIQVIRTSDDVSEARRRLREVFDLSEVQTDYILDLPLRRLTKMSRIELETEQGRLHAEIAELEALLASPDRVRALLASELRAVADAFGTPRRTLLVEANGAGPGRNAVAGSSGAVGGTVTGQGAPVSGPRRAPVSLEHADVACRVLLSASGQLARVDLDAQRRITPPAQRSAHDAVASVIDTTSRSEIGAITSRGRLIRFHPLDLPPLPANAVQLAAGVSAAEYFGLADHEERVIALVSLQDDRPIALGTLSGVAKRVIPGQYPNRPDFEVIALKPGDAVIGAGHAADDAELVFVASDAQLLRFAATAVRPQGCPAGGMAGISLAAGAQARTFAIVPARESDNAVVVTLSSTAGALQGVDIGTGKVAPFSEFPAKGRATGGVRAQRFLKGEDGLAVAWVGTAPPRALGADGSPRALPTTLGKRDGSGTPLDAPIAFLGGTVGGESAGSEAGMRDSE